MLVLSRKIGEKIIINDDVVIEVLSIKGNRTRLGIASASGVSILRQELVASHRAELNHSDGETTNAR